MKGFPRHIVVSALAAFGAAATASCARPDARPVERAASDAQTVAAVKIGRGDIAQLLTVIEVPELQDEIRQDEAAVKRAAEEINRAQADLERARSAHDVAHIAADRLTNVMKVRPNLVAQQDIDEASGRDRVAEAQVAT